MRPPSASSKKIIGFLFLIPSSMLSTVSALGAQNIGAGKPRTRASHTALRRDDRLLVRHRGRHPHPVYRRAARRLFTPDAAVAAAGGQYLRGYIWDSFFAGVQFSFSGYFCACGKSGISFLHNSLSILLVRVPGAYLASKYFPQTLLPMGLANAAGSLFLHPRLRDRLRHPHAAGKTCAGGIINGSSPAFSPSAKWQKFSISA